jgi:hypothetical protein
VNAVRCCARTDRRARLSLRVAADACDRQRRLRGACGAVRSRRADLVRRLKALDLDPPLPMCLTLKAVISAWASLARCHSTFAIQKPTRVKRSTRSACSRSYQSFGRLAAPTVLSWSSSSGCGRRAQPFDRCALFRSKAQLRRTGQPTRYPAVRLLGRSGYFLAFLACRFSFSVF